MQVETLPVRFRLAGNDACDRVVVDLAPPCGGSWCVEQRHERVAGTLEYEVHGERTGYRRAEVALRHQGVLRIVREAAGIEVDLNATRCAAAELLRRAREDDDEVP